MSNLMIFAIDLADSCTWNTHNSHLHKQTRTITIQWLWDDGSYFLIYSMASMVFISLFRTKNDSLLVCFGSSFVLCRHTHSFHLFICLFTSCFSLFCCLLFSNEITFVMKFSIQHFSLFFSFWVGIFFPFIVPFTWLVLNIRSFYQSACIHFGSLSFWCEM